LKKIVNISILIFLILFILTASYGILSYFVAAGEKVENLHTIIYLLFASIFSLLVVLGLFYKKNKIAEEERESLLIQEKKKASDQKFSKENDETYNQEIIRERVTEVEIKFKEEVKAFSTKTHAEKASLILKQVAKMIDADLGILHQVEKGQIKMLASYACVFEDEEYQPFDLEEGLLGEAGKRLVSINVTDIPEGYIKIMTGLGKSSPQNILIVPISNNGTLLEV